MHVFDEVTGNYGKYIKLLTSQSRISNFLALIDRAAEYMTENRLREGE